MRQILYKLYHEMYKYRPTVYFNVFLVKSGIEKQVAYYVRTRKAEKNANKLPKGVRRAFFENNMLRIKSNLMLLYDDKSREIYKAMINYRVSQRRPLAKSVYSLKEQYFVKDIINLRDDEVFVDCGAFVGDTIISLYAEAKKQNKKIKRIVAFEPEHDNFTILKKFFGKNKCIYPIEAGVSDCDGELYVHGSSTEACLSDKIETGSAVSVRMIDNVPECRGATYIKMDIEGAEWAALHGAENTIKSNHPKLAICMYHSDEDMIRLIEYIHELVPEYKLFIRQHSRAGNETVLYAVP